MESAYQALTRVAALYGYASQCDRLWQERARIWSVLGDSTLEDLDSVVDAREVSLRGAQRLTERLERVHRSVSLWTPFHRWLRLLIACERSWCRLLAASVDQERDSSKVAWLMQRSRLRQGTLEELMTRRLADMESTDRAFARPVDLRAVEASQREDVKQGARRKGRSRGG